MAAGTGAAMLRKVQSSASSATAFNRPIWPPTRRKAMKVPTPAPIQANRCSAADAARRARESYSSSMAGVERDTGLDLRKKPRAPSVRRRSAPRLLQEDQQRDARHRQQQHRQHRFGHRAGALQVAELGQPPSQAESQEHHLRHRFGGGVAGDRGRGIGAGHALEDHQPRRRHHAAHRREGRNLGNGIAHQPGEIEFPHGPAMTPAATGNTRQRPG